MKSGFGGFNNFSMIFTSGSSLLNDTIWDSQFPSSSFQPAMFQIGWAAGNAKASFHTYIQTSTDSPISADTAKNLKNLLDKVYGA